MVAFLCSCCYMTVGQGINIGVNLPVIRLVLIAAIFRIAIKGEKVSGGINSMDRLMILWAIWLLFASLFHVWAPGSGPVYTLGSILNTVGFYFLIRSFCHDVEELERIICALCVIILPVALLMLVEQVLHKNFFSIFGGVSEVPNFRDGRYRAQGPFNHAILAGVVGASCFPLAIGIWRRNRKIASIGIFASLLMVVTSASSTPLLSMTFSLLALGLWRFRFVVKPVLLSLIPGYILLSLFMAKPAYWIIARIDLTGSSTGWHRSFLIQQTLKHLDEWWLFGTDFTRHWMPDQGFASETHTDITNQYIAYGVAGGVFCILILIIMMKKSYNAVTRMVDNESTSKEHAFMFWCIGATLFSHTSSSMAVGYFGQALFFFWLPIALLGNFYNFSYEKEADEYEPALET